MKTLFRIILISVLTALTWKYLDEKDIQVSARLEYFIQWAGERAEQLFAGTPEKQQEIYTDETPLTLPSATRPSSVNIAATPNTRRVNNETASITVSTTYTSEGGGDSSSVNVSYGQPDKFKGLNNMDWVKATSKKYAPDSWHLLMLYDNLPNRLSIRNEVGGTMSSPKTTATFHYLEGNSRVQLLRRMSTNVHEIAHGYFSLAKYEYAREQNLRLYFNHAEKLFFLSPSQQIFVSVPEDILFPSRELAGRIHSSLQTFRYKLYIEGNTSTQGEGVVGLLDELYAYYLDAKYSFDMIEAYKLTDTKPEKGFITWVQSCMAGMGAFYEFDFFIKEYLLWMQIRYPENYRTLMAETSFREAYSAVYNAWAQLCVDFTMRIDDQMDFYNNQSPGTFNKMDNTVWLTINRSGDQTGISLTDNDRDKLLKVLKSTRYNSIMPDLGLYTNL